MRSLIVEDDFTSRALLQSLLEPYGTSHVAVDGREALAAYRLACDEGKPYDLICLDIMMPEIDGHEVLKQLRKIEQEKGIADGEGVKIIMTSALSDASNVLQAFREKCDAYVAKPISKQKFNEQLEYLGFKTD